MFDYKRVVVIGCPGAGKSTFSRKLHAVTNLPLFHLDALYWNKDCTHITRAELIEKQMEILMSLLILLSVLMLMLCQKLMNYSKSTTVMW